MISVTDAIANRRSTRAYLDRPVPQDIIREVLDIARLAPSNSNTQPWHIAIASGETRRQLQADIMAEIDSGKPPGPQWPAGGVGLAGAYKERQYDCAFTYYDALGISRDDKTERALTVLKNYEFFGAPHVAFISMPTTMNRANALDLGIFLQSIMLLFAERGIGCIPQGALAAFPEPVKKLCDIPEDNGIVVGISFGYPDESASINDVRQKRRALDDIASFAE